MATSSEITSDDDNETSRLNVYCGEWISCVIKLTFICYLAWFKRQYKKIADREIHSKKFWQLELPAHITSKRYTRTHEKSRDEKDINQWGTMGHSKAHFLFREQNDPSSSTPNEHRFQDHNATNHRKKFHQNSAFPVFPLSHTSAKLTIHQR